MKKRIMSLILAIAMILTMVPESALASNSGGVGLAYRYADWVPSSDGTYEVPVENTNNELLNSYNAWSGGEEVLFFYYLDESGTETRVSPNEIYSYSNEIIELSVCTDNPDAVNVKLLNSGAEEFLYNAPNGNTYTIPVNVNHTSTPSLKWSLVNDQSGVMGESIWSTAGTMESYYFYYVEADLTTKTVVPATNLTVSDSSILSVGTDPANADITILTFNAEGYTEIYYTDHNGMTHYIPVTVSGTVEPTNSSLGFYRDIAGTMPVTDFSVSATETMFYLVAMGGMTITKAELSAASDVYADITIDPSNTYATIQITDVTFGGQYMGNIEITYAGTDGTTPTGDMNCTINAWNNNAPMPTMSGLQCSSVGDTTGMLYGSIGMPAGTVSSYNFYYVDSTGMKTPLSFSDLTVEDSTIATITDDTMNPGAVSVSFITPGTTNIKYEDATGMPYYLNVMVNSTMPAMSGLQCSSVGDTTGMLYGSIGMPAGTVSSYNFYYVDSTGMKTPLSFSDLTVEDSTIAMITDDTMNPGAVIVSFITSGSTSIKYEDATGMPYYLNVMVHSTTPTMSGLQCSQMGDITGMLLGSLMMPVGTTASYNFYYVDMAGAKIAVDFDDLEVVDSTIATIAEDTANPGSVIVSFNTLGSTDIKYIADNGMDYYLNVMVSNSSMPPATSTPSLQCMMLGDASGMMYTGIGMMEGSTVTYKFYYVDPSDPVGNRDVYITDLTVADPTIATISADPSDVNAVIVSFVKEGSTTIDYTVGTETYSVMVTVHAPQAPSVTGKNLVFHWLKSNEDAEFEYDADGNYVPDDTSMPGYKLDMTTESISPVVFYLLDSNNMTKQRLSFDDLAITPGNITLRTEKGAVIIDATNANVGDTADITYFDSDTNAIYTFHVTVVKPVPVPAVGYYATSDATTPISDFTVTSTNNVFYFIATGNWTFTKMKLYEGSENYATVSLDATNKIATVTITDPTLCGNSSSDFCLLYSATDGTESGNNFREHLTVSQPLPPQLMFGMGMNDGNGNWVEDPNAFLMNSDRRAPGYGSDVFFYLVENGNRTLVSPGNITSSNPNVVTVSVSDMNPNAVCITPLTFGSAKIQYTNIDGNIYSMDISVELPMFGFYSTTTASQSSFIREFTLTAGNDTFYFVPNDAYNKFDTVTMSPDMAQIATATISADGSYVAIKVTGSPSDGRNYGVSYTYTNTSGNVPSTGVMNGNAGIIIKDGRPGLKFRMPDYGNNGPIENTMYNLESKRIVSIGGGDEMFFYYVENGVERRLSASDLTSSNENVVTISTSPVNGDAVRLEYVGFGNATVNYTVNGVTYSVNIVVELPSIGLYTTSTASGNTFIRDFTVTDTNNTFYLVARDGWTLNRVDTLGDLTSIATVVVDASKTFATITINGTPVDGMWYEILYDAEHTNGSTMPNSVEHVQLYNGKAALMIGFGTWDNNSYIENPNNVMSSQYTCSPGKSMMHSSTL